MLADRYYEETVTRNPANSAGKKILTAKILKYGAMVLLAFVAIGLPSLGVIDVIMRSAEYAVATKVVFVFLVFVPVIICALLIWLGFRLQAKYTEEFEYRIQDCKFRVIRVVNQSRRKLFREFPLDAIERIGKIESEGCRSAETQIGDNKKSFIRAAVNLKNPELIYYALIKLDRDKLMYFEPSEALLRELRFALGRDLIEHENPVF